MKSNRYWIIVFCFVILASLLVMFFTGSMESGVQGSVAYIYSGGALIEKIDLTETAGRPYTIEVDSGGGRNVVEVGYGCIRMLEADCKSGVCVRQGWVTSGFTLIVCLPNSLVIEVEGGNTDIDGVVG